MSLVLYNTLTATKEPFEPATPSHARIYVCGPTVYDYPHLGHARCYVIYDVLVRHLRATGTKVTYVRNVTDVDDKIMNRAKEKGEAPLELAKRFTEIYWEDMTQLGNLRPDIEPKVSEHIDDIVALIGGLIERGAAYESDGDVYFHVESFPDYGKLSHRKLADLELGASGRTKEEEARRKKHPADFALWKQSSPGELSWQSPWGPGRPGWHIECSAMSMRYLGESIDLHGGGLDLVFPHHENEIAQSESATGSVFSRCWMHNGFVEANKEKMSKSLGNFFTARQIFERVEPEAIRYVMMTMHYRAPLNLDWSVDDAGNVTGFPQFEEAERRLEYLYQTKKRLAGLPDKSIAKGGEPPKEVREFPGALRAALDDDLNMPVAIAKLSELLRTVNELCDRTVKKGGTVTEAAVTAAADAFKSAGQTLGLGLQDPDAVLVRIRDRRARARGIEPGDVEAKLVERTEARKAKDFARADAIRDELATRGVDVLDGSEGTGWTVR